MQIRPIISAMRRNKVGAVLISVQMAITLAILCNALFIIQQRIAWSKRPTGVDEANVVMLRNQWVGNPPDLAHLPPGCAFAPRCSYRLEDCDKALPPLEPVGGIHAKRCIYEGKMRHSVEEVPA